MTKIEIIDDTVGFYSTVSNRSVNEEGSRCLYKSQEGKECAFQRVVENDLSKYDLLMGNGCGSIMLSLREKLKFKRGYEGHGSEFWADIQNLHDQNKNWTDTGLSVAGMERVKELKGKYL